MIKFFRSIKVNNDKRMKLTISAREAEVITEALQSYREGFIESANSPEFEDSSDFIDSFHNDYFMISILLERINLWLMKI